MAQNKSGTISAPSSLKSSSNPPPKPQSGHSDAIEPPSVNRKKQKRRQKQAAKLAAAAVPQLCQHESLSEHGQSVPHTSRTLSNVANAPNGVHHGDGSAQDEEDLFESDDEDVIYPGIQDARMNGHASNPVMTNGDGAKKKSKKKKKKNKAVLPDDGLGHDHYMSSSAYTSHHMQSTDRSQLWNTSTAQERERIKQFWRSLSESERRSLVKIEKDAVLKKMREQQKHSCSCTLCGRKRIAIEEELEHLYESYYGDLGSHDPGHDAEYPNESYAYDEDEDDEQDHSEDDYDEDDDYSQPDDTNYANNNEAVFGESLHVKEGILTVADDLLKNNGKKFIEMMEQMAENRLRRQTQAQSVAVAPYNSQKDDLDEDEYDEAEEDYDSMDDNEDEDVDKGPYGDQQRLEEGRRMFQIFAARMFEQRVLTAYREKVALERQAKLIEELEEDEVKDAQREAKKQRDAQKRKEKKQQQKQAKAEEKARKEEEKRAEEEAARRLEEQKQEDARKKKEEQRKKREAERKAQEQEKARKEAERQKRQQEERERQHEIERKAREHKAQKEKLKEEARKMARLKQEAKDREAAKERKVQADKERQERETRAGQDKMLLERAAGQEKSTQEKLRVESQKRLMALSSTAVAVPPSLQRNASNFSSPHVAVATPALPKASTPVRKPTSQQGSKGSSPNTPQPTGHFSKPVSPIAVAALQQLPLHLLAKSTMSKPPGIGGQMQPISHSPILPALQSILPLPGMPTHGFAMPNGFPSAPPPMGLGGINAPSLGSIFSSHAAPGPNQFRYQPGPLVHANLTMAGPPPTRAFADIIPGIGQHGMAPSHPPGFGPIGRDNKSSMAQHNRQASASSAYEVTVGPASHGSSSHRPAPIQRPSSVKPIEIGFAANEFNAQLGSSALLGDTDDALLISTESRRSNPLPPVPRSASNMSTFAGSTMFTHGQVARTEPFGVHPSVISNSAWLPTSQGSFTSPTIGPTGTWGPTAGGTGGWPGSAPKNNFSFSLGGPAGIVKPRPLQLRMNICNLCRVACANKQTNPNGFIEAGMIVRNIEHTISPPATINEILDICETEGNPTNGGGNFIVRLSHPLEMSLVRFDDGSADTIASAPIGLDRTSTVGEIGSSSMMNSISHSLPPPPALFPNLGASSQTGFHQV